MANELNLNQLEELRVQREQADVAYHGEDAPIMDDAEYDALCARISSMEVQNGVSPVRGVGSAPSARFLPAKHTMPMLSLDNAFEQSDLVRFDTLVRKTLPSPRYLSEPKVDGLSLSLTYENGVLVRASTRGDGATGEDVTANARRITNVPQQLVGADLPRVVDVRGEVYIGKADFTALNERQSAEGARLYANPRNAAAGAVRQINPEVTARRPLRFMAYAIGSWEGTPSPTTQESLLTVLRGWGFDIPSWVASDSIEGLMAAHQKLSDERMQVPYDIDGIVHKVDSMDARTRLGMSSRVPRWAIAHKFAPTKAITILNGIDFQVGRTGTLTPVADLEPVNVGGVLVSRATLHNAAHIRRLDLRPGDTVTIYRAGDVIPRVEGVVPGLRPEHSMPTDMPSTCPSCGGHIEEAEGGILKCYNVLSCPAQAVERIRHLASRDVWDIDGLGGGKVEDLVQSGMVKTAADLFRLHLSKDILVSREGWGERSVSLLLNALETRRELALDRFLSGLGIKEVGRTSGRLLAAKFLSWTAFRTAAENAVVGGDSGLSVLLSVEGIGPVVLSEITKFFLDDRLVAGLDDILSEVTILSQEPPAHSASAVAGMTLVFTGTLHSTTREKAEERARLLGAKVSSSVSKNTSLLIAGEAAGSKLAKAEALGVRVMTEEEWITLSGTE